MTDRPIIFSAPMICSLWDGHKTNTRRILKPQPERTDTGWWHLRGASGGGCFCDDENDLGRLAVDYVRYAPGDRLWVRENWRPTYDGLREGRPRSQCRACVNLGNKAAREKRRARDPDAYKADAAKWNKQVREKRGPEKERAFNRKSALRRYGMTLECFDRLFAEQGNACAICRSTEKRTRWVVDHDHQTGAVRGILCSLCNTGLGQFADDCGRLKAAILYLEAHDARVSAAQAIGRGKWRRA